MTVQGVSRYGTGVLIGALEMFLLRRELDGPATAESGVAQRIVKRQGDEQRQRQHLEAQAGERACHADGVLADRDARHSAPGSLQDQRDHVAGDEDKVEHAW